MTRATLRIATPPAQSLEPEDVPYTLAQAAGRAGMPHSSFARAVRTGQIPEHLVLRFGPRTIRIARGGFDAWLRGDA